MIVVEAVVEIAMQADFLVGKKQREQEEDRWGNLAVVARVLSPGTTIMHIIVIDNTKISM